MKVIYPICVFEEIDGGFVVNVPDFNNSTTEGETLEEALYMAQDLIAGFLLDESNKVKVDVPKASDISEIDLEKISNTLEAAEETKNKFKKLVVVDLSEFAEKWSNKSIKKNLTIPQWLNTKAEALNINFSQVLQEALLQKISK
ncbi:MAG: type II toxin-antitoxin system HicB family antitoxin [Lachnospiraceae bacterium]|jgi:predicted RNase H-like HicB family nuclease|nr:type II toxin-antitoxin system HicB family antitoxin [Lachnospiraceae bacterium]